MQDKKLTQIQTLQNRENFAISLRKEKHDSIMKQKREQHLKNDSQMSLFQPKKNDEEKLKLQLTYLGMYSLTRKKGKQFVPQAEFQKNSQYNSNAKNNLIPQLTQPQDFQRLSNDLGLVLDILQNSICSKLFTLENHKFYQEVFSELREQFIDHYIQKKVLKEPTCLNSLVTCSKILNLSFTKLNQQIESTQSDVKNVESIIQILKNIWATNYNSVNNDIFNKEQSKFFKIEQDSQILSRELQTQLMVWVNNQFENVKQHQSENLIRMVFDCFMTNSIDLNIQALRLMSKILTEQAGELKQDQIIQFESKLFPKLFKVLLKDVDEDENENIFSQKSQRENDLSQHCLQVLNQLIEIGYLNPQHMNSLNIEKLIDHYFKSSDRLICKQVCGLMNNCLQNDSLKSIMDDKHVQQKLVDKMIETYKVLHEENINEQTKELFQALMNCVADCYASNKALLGFKNASYQITQTAALNKFSVDYIIIEVCLNNFTLFGFNSNRNKCGFLRTLNVQEMSILQDSITILKCLSHKITDYNLISNCVRKMVENIFKHDLKSSSVILYSDALDLLNRCFKQNSKMMRYFFEDCKGLEYFNRVLAEIDELKIHNQEEELVAIENKIYDMFEIYNSDEVDHLLDNNDNQIFQI